MDFLFSGIAGLFGKIALLYFLQKYYDIMMIVLGMILALVIAWKHVQKSTSWKFNPKQVMDFTLLAIALYLILMGTLLTIVNHVVQR